VDVDADGGDPVELNLQNLDGHRTQLDAIAHGGVAPQLGEDAPAAEGELAHDEEEHIKDIFHRERPLNSLTEVAREIAFVPETLELDRLRSSACAPSGSTWRR
jgi:hypothetical protein